MISLLKYIKFWNNTDFFHEKFIATQCAKAYTISMDIRNSHPGTIFSAIEDVTCVFFCHYIMFEILFCKYRKSLETDQKKKFFYSFFFFGKLQRISTNKYESPKRSLNEILIQSNNALSFFLQLKLNWNAKSKYAVYRIKIYVRASRIECCIFIISLQR